MIFASVFHARASRWVVAALLLLPVVVIVAGAPVARGENPACGDVTVVFARGSGQRLAQRESAVFFAALSVRLGTAVRATAYELGTATYGGTRYPAVGVGVDSSDAFENLLDAGSYWTGNAGGRYRASVRAGAIELRAYLEQRLRACPDERVILGGYSQGAQVVGDALPTVPRSLRDRIVFVGLFGDPKLSLPEGRGIFPAACQGRSLSPWRRGNVSCYTDNGVLEARSPYVPADLARRVGSWCDRDDPICNNNLGDFAHSTHGLYAKPGRAVDQAVREAAAAIPGTPESPPVNSFRPTPADDAQSAETREVEKSSASAASVALVIDEYWTRPGTPVTFDASASALPPSAVAAYRWDFDGDGTTDRTTPVPTVAHVYPEPFQGRVRLRVSAADGAELMAGAVVHVDRVGLARQLPADPTGVTVRAAHGPDGAVVRWRPGTAVDGQRGAVADGRRGTVAGGPVDAWRVHDAAGRLLVHVPGSARQADLPALPDRTTALTVEAVNEYGSSVARVAVPHGTGSSRFADVVPAGNVTGADGGALDGVRTVDAGEADARGLSTAPLAAAVVLLLATVGALGVTLARAGSLRTGGAGRHRKRRCPF
ncbi:cutinase family protein [Cryptosporangium aurantiacum]|uniref:PKD domain-containing protein n=1 Tax=Cryptosporangium aurantiacum TaxID=134849 RepID=A0A1M7JP59_9ACTN|nr:cutinase family protein [Cryptosporangium aurantiacum]SHM54327.1 PKD domain-containing protein [Cryptosporangium aurantiacum]